MRAALLLAVFCSLAIIIAVVAARHFTRGLANRRAIRQLEAANEHLDRLIEKQHSGGGVFREPVRQPEPEKPADETHRWYADPQVVDVAQRTTSFQIPVWPPYYSTKPYPPHEGD